MDEEDLNSGLLGIALSDSDDDDSGKEYVEPAPTSREERNAQSEEDFWKLKSTYRVKVENGEIWKRVQLPLGDKVSKPAAQELVHAVEELYFFRRCEAKMKGKADVGMA
ncbi:hypothetical protein NKR19_g10053 [Coniochaeta hoffmannii]|uniref:Uncharacterized protein n=1 Tax=Coniochaeta hoffmannii TaxID=91930 RepID=A0AA38VIL6_9PEZI|nr:hypothetical protein NKR19_g10053 [Coniochaeta hoffmannii]